MNEIMELAYVLTMMIAVVPFAMQFMASGKNLAVSNSMIKSKNTTVFLGLIIIYNICDFLIIFFRGQEFISWIYVVENVLEVGLAYQIIAMEADMARSKIEQWIQPCFSLIASVIFMVDLLFSTNLIVLSENTYMAIMITLNAVPIIPMGYFCIKYMKMIIKEHNNKLVEVYLMIYNIVFIVLCVVATLSMLDSRTSLDYFKNDKGIYVIFWLVFNSLNIMFVWYSCGLVEDKVDEKVQIQCNIETLAGKFGLSTREQEMAKYLYEGMNNAEIADLLFLSTNTVKVHVSNLYKKLGVCNRVQAIQIIRGNQASEPIIEKSV